MNTQFRLRLLQLSVSVLLSAGLSAGADLELRMFKTSAPQQVSRMQSGNDGCSGSAFESRSQPYQTMVEGDASRSKTHNRTRGQVRKQRNSESRYGSFTTQYDYAPVPSGI